MKCNHCGSEWTVNPTISNSIKSCPFCGETLLSDKERPCTTESVLAKIYKQYGIGVLLDGQKLISFFSDLAPQLMKERRILKYFIECNGPQKINNVVGSSENEQAICVKQLIKEMKDELFIEESASRMICEAFISVLLPNHPLKDYSDSHTNPESSLGIPIVEMKQSPPEMTAEE